MSAKDVQEEITKFMEELWKYIKENMTKKDLIFFIQLVVLGLKVNPNVDNSIPETIEKTFKDKFKKELNNLWLKISVYYVGKR